MTKKDYEMVADVIQHRLYGDRDWSPCVGDEDVVQDLVHELVDKFEADNPRFDRDRFLIACGVPR